MYRSLKQQRLSCILKNVFRDRKGEEKMFLDNLSASVLRFCRSHGLSYKAASEQCRLSSRYPMPVTQIRSFRYAHLLGRGDYPVCPRCGITLEREYQAFCDRCGQCLNWKEFSKAVVISSGK